MLTTARLTLRNWRDTDRVPFSRLNGDPRVVGDFPGVMTPSESDALMEQFAALWAEDGFSYGAVERLEDGAFLGMAGITQCRTPPCFEIGWALLPAYWRQGFATEAALAWLAHGFDALGLPQVLAFTEAKNTRSRAVMRRIGMRPAPTPKAKGRHRITRTEWLARA